MRLALPLGLLGLITIAALILIYILKPKYQDKKVSSTYVWKLSLRYQKRKVPLQWLQNWLLILLQVLILAVIAFMMARPYVVLASQSGEKIVILDGSASMLAATGRSTRFDRAKNEISDLADITVPADKFSIILAGDEASFVVRRSDSAGLIKQKLSEAKCTLAQPNLHDAMELAEGVLAENPGAEVYLYTDCDYTEQGSVKVINISNSEWNAAVTDFSAKRVNGNYVFTAEISSYGRSGDLAVTLVVDGKSQRPKLATYEDGETTQVVWEGLSVVDYDQAEVHLEANDSFLYDNDFYLYNPAVERFKIQLVGEDSSFLLFGLSAWGKGQVDLVTDFEAVQSSGYDLYVYDGYVPETRPTDGAVLLVNPPKDIGGDWGITISGRIGGQKEEMYLAGEGSTSDAARSIMRGVTPTSIYVTEYSRVVTYVGYESLISCDGDPVLLVKNESGLKTAVIAFDIHMSDISMHYDFPILMTNLCNYTMQCMVGKTLYEVGDTVSIGTKPDVETLALHAEYLSGTDADETITVFPAELKAAQAGAYTVTQKLASGREVVSSFFVRVNAEESVFNRTEASLAGPVMMPGTGAVSGVNYDTKDIYVYLAAAMLVLLCVEWGLQYREQY